MIGLKQKLLKGVYVTGENDWYEVGSKLPIFTPFHKFRILEKRGLISEAPVDELEETPLEEEATPEEITVVDDEAIEEALEDEPVLEEEAIRSTLETPTIDETPKPQTKGKKK
jgi:hypothetical protein